MGLVPGAFRSADVLVMQNIPSSYRKASKLCWVYPLQTRESMHVFGHLRTLIQETFSSLNIPLRHFYVDGGAKLVASDVLCYLYSVDATISHSARDTLQMNSITKPWIPSFKKVLCMLLQFSLPVALVASRRL